jgi:hypothetical protein
MWDNESFWTSNKIPSIGDQSLTTPLPLYDIAGQTETQTQLAVS